MSFTRQDEAVVAAGVGNGSSNQAAGIIGRKHDNVRAMNRGGRIIRQHAPTQGWSDFLAAGIRRGRARKRGQTQQQNKSVPDLVLRDFEYAAGRERCRSGPALPGLGVKAGSMHSPAAAEEQAHWDSFGRFAGLFSANGNASRRN
jgi:hypothetical protein